MPAVRYVHHIDLVGNELRNACVQNVAGLPAPVAARAGWIVYNTVDGRLYYCTGTAWELRATDTDLFGGQAPAYYLDRAHHTGQIPASEVSGLDEEIQSTPLNEFAAPTGPIDLANQELINAGPATSDSSVPTWGQVVDLVANLGFKHVRLGSTGNVTIASTGVGAVIDGVPLVLDDIILLKDQTNAVENGIYKVAQTSMARDPKNATAEQMPSGTVVIVDQGSTNADHMFMLTTSAGFVVGQDPLEFSPFGIAPNPYTAGDGISIVSNTISVVAGQGIVVNSGGVSVDTTVIGRIFDIDIPAPASGTSLNLTHNLGRRPIPNTCMEMSSGDEVKPGINYPDTNNIIVDFAIAPVVGQYRLAVG